MASDHKVVSRSSQRRRRDLAPATRRRRTHRAGSPRTAALIAVREVRVGYLRRWTMGLVWLLCGIALQAAGDGSVTGTVTDQSGARLPGVGVQVVASAGARALASTTTDAEGAFRIERLPEGEYWIEFALSGFAKTRQRIAVVGGGTQAVTATLGVDGLSEAVQVSSRDVRLDADRPTLSASFSNEMLADVPSPSRNYTHVIVAEAGVSAPLPDRTGRNLNLATEPGAQGEDGSQTLNPSVNGARPTNNALRVNGIDTTNMLSASGGLGGSLGVPLEALEEIEVQTALTSAAQGRNGGGSIDIVTRQGTNRFNGTGLYAFQHESMNANEFFLNRAGTAKPEFRRNDAQRRRWAVRSVRAARSSSSPDSSTRLQVRLRQQRHRGDRPAGRPRRRADARDASPASPTTTCATAPPTTRPSPPTSCARCAPSRPISRPGLIATFFTDVNTLTFRELTPADIHPVAINILNTKRDGRFLIPSTTGDMPVLRGNGTFGRELLQQQVIPTESNGWSGVVTVQHRADRQQRHAGHVRALAAARRGGVRVGRRLAVADRRQHAGAARRRHQHAHLRLAAAAGSQRRLLRPGEHAHLEQPRHLQLDARHLQPARGIDRRPGRADADHRHQHAAQLRRHRQRLGLLRSPARAARRRRAGRSSPASTRCSRASSTGACGSTASTCRAPTATWTTTTGCSSSPATAPRAADRTSIRATPGATSAPRTSACSCRTTGRSAAA